MNELISYFSRHGSPRSGYYYTSLPIHAPDGKPVYNDVIFGNSLNFSLTCTPVYGASGPFELYASVINTDPYGTLPFLSQDEPAAIIDDPIEQEYPATTTITGRMPLCFPNSIDSCLAWDTNTNVWSLRIHAYQLKIDDISPEWHWSNAVINASVTDFDGNILASASVEIDLDRYSKPHFSDTYVPAFSNTPKCVLVWNPAVPSLTIT